MMEALKIWATGAAVLLPIIAFCMVVTLFHLWKLILLVVMIFIIPTVVGIAVKSGREDNGDFNY